MAKKGLRQSIGELFFGVTADTQQAEDALDRLKGKAEQAADTAEQTSARTKKSLGDAATNLQATTTRQIGVITGLVAGAAAVTALATTMFTVGTKISSVLFNIKKDSEEAAKGIDAMTFAFDRIKKATPDLTELQEQHLNALKKSKEEIQETLDKQAEQIESSRSQLESLRSRATFYQTILIAEKKLAELEAQRKETIEKRNELESEFADLLERARDFEAASLRTQEQRIELRERESLQAKYSAERMAVDISRAKQLLQLQVLHSRRGGP